MPMLSPREAWDTTLDQIALRVGRAEFETWLKGTEVIAYEDGEFTVKVRHAYAKDWLERHLLHDITSLLSRTIKRAAKVHFTVHLPHRHKESSLSDAGPLFNALAEPTRQKAAAPAMAAPDHAATPAPHALPATTGTVQAGAVAASQVESPASTPPSPPATVAPDAATAAGGDYSEWDPRFTDVRRTLDRDTANTEHSITPLNPAFTFETFVTGTSNEFAHAAAQAIVETPGTRYNPLVIFGGVGLGKTHLLHAIGHALRAAGRDVLYATAETFTNETIDAIRGRTTGDLRQRYRSVDVLLVDDFQFMAGKSSTEEEFYHTFNTIVGRGGQVVVAINQHPRQLTKLDERLRSRLEGGLITDIQAPEQATRHAILRVKSSAQGVSLPEDVAQALAVQAVANVRELEGMLTQVLARAQLGRQPLTVALAQQVLRLSNSQAVHQPASKPNISRILEATATYHQLSLDDLLSKRRTQKIARARQIAMYIAREETNASLPQIGEALGGRNHSTVLYGCNKIAEALKEDGSLKTEIDSIRQTLFSKD